MREMVADLATPRKGFSSRPDRLLPPVAARYVASMATRPHKPQRKQRTASVTRIRAGKVPHLYVKEHMEAARLDAPRLAGRLEMHEKAVYKAIKEQSRIWKDIQAWAHALGLEDWRDLTMPPGQPSIDARIDRVPPEFQEAMRRAVGKP